jgi:hypothetical protein
MKGERVRGSSISFMGLLSIVLIGLKLIGAISLPWLWVLAPIWISVAIELIVFVLLIIYFSLRK